MKRLPLLLFLIATPAFAQVASSPTATPTPAPLTKAPPRPVVVAAKTTPAPSVAPKSKHSPTPAPSAVPKSKKAPTPSPAAVAKSKQTPAPSASATRSSFLGVFRRMWPFGHHKQPAAIEAAAAVTPPPVSHKANTPPKTPKAAPSPSAVTASTPEPNVKHPAVAVSTPVPAPAPAKKPAPEPAPAVAPTSAPVVNAVPAPVPAPPVQQTAAEKDRYLQLRAQADGAPEVSSLLQKVHSAEPGSDAYKSAAHKYNKAVFSKIRQLDPSLGEDIDRREGAYDRRIDAGKPLAD